MRSSRFANTVAVFALSSTLIATSVSNSRAAVADDATVAWLRDGNVEMFALSGAGGQDARKNLNNADARVPLGSLWKLFVFAYLADTHANELPYQCPEVRGVQTTQASQIREDRYCCTPGESIVRAKALARSCAPYFSPTRLGVTGDAWRSYWKKYHAANWLLEIGQLQPETTVPVGELLNMLVRIPASARAEARSALLETGIEGYGREAWTTLGTGIRYKTYSWHREDGSAFGGAAGWLADGTPFWFGARGSSRSTLTTWASQLAAALPPFSATRAHMSAGSGNASEMASNNACVDVDFFARYPIRAVLFADETSSGKNGVLAGDLKGRYRVAFANGNWLAITSRGELALNISGVKSNIAADSENAEPAYNITGRFTLNDYVARVIDREGNARQPQAARALAIAARSYLVQNAHIEAGCWHIKDASSTQRVSPNPPSQGALEAAWFTDDIVLKGAPVQYHRDAPGRNRLAWKDTVLQATEGWNFERILAHAYPQAAMATLTGREECARLDAAEHWLAQSAMKWRTRLRTEPGYELLNETPRICVLTDGNPYSDQQRLRIYVRGWNSLNERVTLAHEYLHLVFRFHPNGADEAYVERLARRLIEG